MKKALYFIIITFLFSWSMWGLQYFGQEGVLPEWVQLFGMFGLFGPLLGFVVLNKLDGESIKDSFKKLFTKSPKWVYLFIVVVPMAISFIAYLVYRETTTLIEPLGVTWISLIPIALMILFVGGPIEEFGWRGYLHPLLRKKYHVIVVILIMGLVHGLWHFPLHYLNGTVQSALPVYEFIIVTIAITFSYGFIYEYAKSIIPMILLHWMANLSSAIFPYYYNSEGRYALLVLFLVLDVILFVTLLRSNKKLGPE